MNDFQSRVGVRGSTFSASRTPPTRERRVIAEEGPRKGRLAAIQTDHANGRVDAQVFVDTVRRTISLGGNR